MKNVNNKIIIIIILFNSKFKKLSEGIKTTAQG